MVRKIFRNKQAMFGLVIIVLVIGTTVFGPMIAPNHPSELHMEDKFSPPNATYPLGTDQMGRCICSRLIYGARYSIGIAIPIMLLLISIGTVLGMIGGYFGGIFDRVLNVVSNIFMAFPPLVVVLALVGMYGQGISNLMIAIVLSMWVWFAKVVRSCVLIEKNKDYIISAKIAGANKAQILFSHILPNIITTLLVYFSTNVASVILMISGYSFLGLGFEKGVPEWGAMLNDAKLYIYSQPSLVIYPGLCIILTAIGFNMFGEAIRDILSQED